MRISEDELCTLDVEWYGVDGHGNIAVFCSSGAANVPEFVCESKERVDLLIEFFGTLPESSECEILFTPSKKNPRPYKSRRSSQKRGCSITIPTTSRVRRKTARYCGITTPKTPDRSRR